MEPGALGSVERVLAAVEAAAPVEAVDAVARELGSAFGALEVTLFVTDLSGRAMVRLAHVPLRSGSAAVDDPPVRGERRDDEESATVFPFDGGVHEQAIRRQSILVLPPEPDEGTKAEEEGRRGAWSVVAPVTERGEVIGLLELTVSAEPRPDVVAEIGRVAHLLAFVIIANRRHTDLFEWGQRSRAFSLSAEIQQRLLPAARTCEASSFTLAGWLEPAADIGGDTFDYSLARDSLHLSLTDAMGHGVESALTASVCIGGLRGARRRGLSLLDQAAETNAVLHEHAAGRAGNDFVAGLIGRVDLGSGHLEIVNAGHVLPFLLRENRLTTVELPASVPLGMFADSTYVSTSVPLEPGDRVILVTDGMLERHVASVDLPSAMHETRHLHPREVVRALADRALAAAGHALQDDATLLCLDWHGAHHEERDAMSGAEQSRASRGSAPGSAT
jgi:serine phosphatase RsbU (regulator of sigma subunit)